MDDKTIFQQILELAVSFFTKKEVAVQIDIPDGPAPEKAPETTSAPVVENSKPPLAFILTHTRFCSDGIFGELKHENGLFIAYTLEHSYENKPKLVNGMYKCIRGSHRLHGMTEDFTTFEITGIPNFNGVPVTGVLFHWGNYNKDSEGCVLMGESETPTMITNSKMTWSNFMDSLEGINYFQLTVQS